MSEDLSAGCIAGVLCICSHAAGIDCVGKGGMKDCILRSQEGVIISLTKAALLLLPGWLVFYA